ncbi:helix-turn-helix domain-containing protein [Halobellus litoreus]|uniref:Helix-turn-helix domain-containing protein n=1 Tax=Halobellus litoreus TaxID=755310 RepID=A0ABD6DXU2_9EURY|nr:helix-turn-helix domain-containing protein [Halobellus litoreus]
MPIITRVYFSHPRMALAHVIESLPHAKIRALQEVSTDPTHNMHYFVVDTGSTQRFEESVESDHTVATAQWVPSYENQPVYRIEFTPDTLLLGSVVTEENGFALNAYRHGDGWIERWQLPDQKSLQKIWNFADQKSFAFEIFAIQQVSNYGESKHNGLTEKQQELLAIAYRDGYFDKPREMTLEEIAEELDISTSAASGRLRRGMKKLIELSDIDALIRSVSDE